MATSKALGDDGEQLALKYLEKKGLKLITRNFRQRGGEIDLIMQDAKALVFIEVRRRQSEQFGSALESVTYQKQQRLIQTAQYYLQQNKRIYSSYRFDVVGILPLNNDFNINWVKDAFQLN
jgi:putative endonuclease